MKITYLKLSVSYDKYQDVELFLQQFEKKCLGTQSTKLTVN